MAALVHSAVPAFPYTLSPPTSPFASTSFVSYHKHQSSYRSASSSDPSRRRLAIAKQRTRRPSIMGTTASSSDFSTDEEDELEEEEYAALESSRRRSIDSEHSSFSASRPIATYCRPMTTSSSTSVNAWFNVNAPSHSALPCYSPPDPSSPFTKDVYDDLDDREDVLYESERPRSRIRRSADAIFHRRGSSEVRSPVAGTASRSYSMSVHDDDDDDEEPSQPHVPSRAESVRKQWDSITIRLDLAVFRAKKRLANKLRSTTV